MTHLAYEFHLAPDVVERQSERYIMTMHRYLKWRNVMHRKANEEARGARGR